MKLLPKTQWSFDIEDRWLIAGCWESPPGVRHFRRYGRSDLPNDLIGLDDLERFEIDLVEVAGELAELGA